MIRLHDAETRFGENCEGLFQHHTQIITDELMEELKSERLAKRAIKAGAMNRVARVPTFVWELWMRQGRDPHNASARQIVSWLERDDLNCFVTAANV